MFETSTIRAQARTATRRLSVLSVSVIAHTAIFFGAVAVSIASVDFPKVAPDEYARAPFINVVQIPPPLGRPDGGATRPRQPDQQPVQKPPVNQLTAPSTLPEDVKPVDGPSTGSGDSEANTGGTVEGPAGVPWGTEKSIGDLDAPPGIDAPVQPPVAETRIYQPHEVVAPVLISRVDPRYPPTLIKAAVPATVVVRCVIDKNGNVRDPEVVVPASMAPFNGEVLRVITAWRYKPATYAGRAVDSYLTLTVHFSVKR